MTTVLQERKMQNLIRRTLIETIRGIIADPDSDLELREGVMKRLKRYSKKSPRDFVSLEAVKKRYK